MVCAFSRVRSDVSCLQSLFAVTLCDCTLSVVGFQECFAELHLTAPQIDCSNGFLCALVQAPRVKVPCSFSSSGIGIQLLTNILALLELPIWH